MITKSFSPDDFCYDPDNMEETPILPETTHRWDFQPEPPARTLPPEPPEISLEESRKAAEELAEKLRAANEPRIHSGVLSFPDRADPKTQLVGSRGQIRSGEPHFFNGSAGTGKSTTAAGTSMAWPLGLPCMGLTPCRPLRILHMNGEDDVVTLGQCREGFLKHSEAITGRRLTHEDLRALDGMLRTDFSREFVGAAFIAHVDQLLTEQPADILIINPLMSFVGGEVVSEASNFLRVLLNPLLQRHKCAALIFHHTPKLSKDSWANMDETYTGIGGGEVANVPRSIFTMIPTPVPDLVRLVVAKRKLSDWRDAEGNFTDHAYFRRSGDPLLPAWIPVPHDEALDLISDSGSKKNSPAITAEAVLQIIGSGAVNQAALLKDIGVRFNRSATTAKNALENAMLSGLIGEFEASAPNSKRRVKWHCAADKLDYFMAREFGPQSLVTPIDQSSNTLTED